MQNISNKKKVAITYHGISSGKSDEKGVITYFDEAFKSVKKNIIQANPSYNFDVYFHSWKNDKESEIITMLNPKRYEFEKKKEVQEFFIPDVSACDLNSGEALVCSPIIKAYSIFSRNYSLKRSIHIIENPNDYDYIISLRFDLVMLADLNLSVIQKDRLYVNGWGLTHTQPGKKHLDGALIDEANIGTVLEMGFPDYMFIFVPQHAFAYATIFDCLPSYLNRDSEYEKTFIDRNGVKGWPVKLSGHPLSCWHIRNIGLLCNVSSLGRCDIDLLLARNYDKEYIIGQQYSKEQKWDEAIQHYRKARGYGKDFNMHLEICVAYTRLGKIKEALIHAKISNELHANVNAQNNIGILSDILQTMKPE